MYPQSKLTLVELSDRIMPRAGLPTPDHVVIVVEENKAFSEIRNNSNAPYLNALADGPNSVLLTQSFGVQHPSQPNYLDLFSGSNQGVTNDAISPSSFTTPNLAANLQAAGRSVVGYSEDLPAVGSLITNTAGSNGSGLGGYWRKHNPWSNWQGTGTNQLAATVNQPFNSFPSDYSQLPTVSFVVPNQANDMHDGTIAQADSWLQSHLGDYATWAATHNSLLIVTFDEDDSSANNQIFTVISGAGVKSGQNATNINHYGVLRTIEDMYALPYAGNSATANPLTGIWKSPADPGFYAVGGDGVVVLNKPDGTTAQTLHPFAGFTGSVRTASADFNGDGIGDIVAGTGAGIATRVVILDGANPSHTLFDIAPFESTFLGGVNLAVGDLNGDGVPDLVIAPDEGGGPRCRVFNGTNFSAIDDFFGIDDPNFRGGARVSIGDVNGDGRGDLIVAAGFGGGPRIAGFSGPTLGGSHTKVFGDFFAFEQQLRNGTNVSVGDINGDGIADLVVGAGPGGGPRVTVFDGAQLRQNVLTRGPDYFAGSDSDRGGVRVAVKRIDDSPYAAIITGDGPGGDKIRRYDHAALNGGTPSISEPFPGSTSGVFVG